jgi:hypothetical protein
VQNVSNFDPPQRQHGPAQAVVWLTQQSAGQLAKSISNDEEQPARDAHKLAAALIFLKKL